jgi:hypothetical protein
VSENLQKFIGIAVMAVIVVVGVVVTNNDDSDFTTTRNAAFVKLGDIKGEVKDDGAASKGGDCCDETLYRLGQIEDRLSRIELALEANAPVERLTEEERARIEFGQARDALAVALDSYLDRNISEDWFNSTFSAEALGSNIAESGLLHGVQVEVARLAVRQIGVGFEHRSADGEPTGEIAHRGTRRQQTRNHATVMAVGTRNGIVEWVLSFRVAPGN